LGKIAKECLCEEAENNIFGCHFSQVYLCRMEILDGKLVSNAVKERLKQQTADRIKSGKKTPHLAAILIGNNGASETYVASKVKSCSEIGYKSTLIRLPEDISETSLLNKLNELNDDFDIDGILVQLPLPKHISEQKMLMDFILRVLAEWCKDFLLFIQRHLMVYCFYSNIIRLKPKESMLLY
jgi:hypothetical protein